ncbi:hypothetical protein CYFUS_009041 [Cystobacter fuscus]|uniref:ARG and Rhodanese-Phosphatase-superfamily-associated domain-containing protein n=1 Tax=Cystobacter fuscus TaxID=43 RepID=A0A250JJJ0_9BACT|nr:hypothetical protein [Cystobacter fuscus]ATB43561.1 hypothetical protein CYFUS_009041 [Cystobacter fuscus]
MKAKVSVTNIVPKGLRLAPSQVWGTLRLVPVLRDEVREDLRFAQRSYDDDLTLVSLKGGLKEPGLKYLSYVPHGLVMSWEGRHAEAVVGTQLKKPEGKALKVGPHTLRLMHRMVRREEKNRLRMLPLHLAMEGFLSLHFGGPEVAWAEYSREALSHGLDPRTEWSVPGWANPLFDEALRVFEIHERQVGVLLFHADLLLSAFIVSHPEDYRALHRTLLEDFYGELLLQYGFLDSAASLESPIDERRVSSLGELRAAVERMREDWAWFQGFMAGGLFGAEVWATSVYGAGPFHLQRFVTSLQVSEENHIGELITREDGTLEYLKTYRLSAAQTRRAYLLKQLALADWNLDRAAESLKTTRAELILRLRNAGFGYLLKDSVK